MLYKVTVPQIYHQAIIDYLVSYDLVNTLPLDEILDEEGITFERLCNPNFLKKSDAVFTFVERTYDFRGEIKGPQKKIYVSLREYGRFMCPFIVFAKSKGIFEDVFSDNLALPDKCFINVYLKLRRADDDARSESDSEERIKLFQKAEKMKDLIYMMLREHASLSVHINLLHACESKDRWYIRQLLHYNAQVFQEPYVDNVQELTLADTVYGYHIYSYTTSKLWKNYRPTKDHIKSLARIREFTPTAQRKAFNLLSVEKQNKIKKLFPDDEKKVTVKTEADYDEETDSDEDGRFSMESISADV